MGRMLDEQFALTAVSDLNEALSCHGKKITHIGNLGSLPYVPAPGDNSRVYGLPFPVVGTHYSLLKALPRQYFFLCLCAYKGSHGCGVIRQKCKSIQHHGGNIIQNQCLTGTEDMAVHSCWLRLKVRQFSLTSHSVPVLLSEVEQGTLNISVLTGFLPSLPAFLH